MAFTDLSKVEQETVLEVMKFIYTKQEYIGDSEFQTRTGITRPELEQVIHNWPSLNDSMLINQLAINNSFNEVLHGLNISDEVWTAWFSESRDKVREVYFKWRETNRLKT